MPWVVGVHGIAQQFKGPNSLHGEWMAALCDGIQLAGGTPPPGTEFVCAFYGDLFRPSGTRSVGMHPNEVGELIDPFETELLAAWWHEAVVVEAGHVTGPDESTRGRTPTVVQCALHALSHSRFFTGIAERAFILDLKQVSAYFHDDDVRYIAPSGLSKQSVPTPAWSSLTLLGRLWLTKRSAANPQWPVTTLVTLGSPLGVRNLIFDRLRPSPSQDVGIWPGSVQRWVNVADRGDIVAVTKDLRPLFGPRVENVLIHNGATAHDIRAYLTARETGDAIASGLQ